MKAWKRLLLLLSGARRLTWLYRVPKDRELEPEDNPSCQPSPASLPPGPALGRVPHFTWLHRCLHHAPGVAPALPSDEVLSERLQPVSHQGMESRTEGGQHQVPHIWAQPAIPQLGLEAAQWAWVQRYQQRASCPKFCAPRATFTSSTPRPSHRQLHLLNQVSGGPKVRDDFIHGSADGYQETWGGGGERSIKAPVSQEHRGPGRTRFMQSDPVRGGQCEARAGCPTFLLLLQLAGPTLGFCHPQSLGPGDTGEGPGTADCGEERRRRHLPRVIRGLQALAQVTSYGSTAPSPEVLGEGTQSWIQHGQRDPGPRSEMLPGSQHAPPLCTPIPRFHSFFRAQLPPPRSRKSRRRDSRAHLPPARWGL